MIKFEWGNCKSQTIQISRKISRF